MVKKAKQDVSTEDKRVKFKRVVEPRVRKAIKGIDLIGNCASSAYKYTEDDIAAITLKLLDTVTQLEKRFTTKGVQQADFNLD